MRFCGLDEAALGPRLGPFCAGLVEFDRSLECSPTTNLYHLLKNAVASNLNDGGRLAVTDSKKIYSPSRGIQLLEQSVWVFLELAGIGFPQNLHGLVQALCPPGDYARMKESPWFEDPSLTTLPLSDIRMEQIRRQARSVQKSLDSVDLRFRPPRLRFVTAKAFNESLIAHQGKSPAVCSIISPLLTHALNGYDSEPGPTYRR